MNGGKRAEVREIPTNICIEKYKWTDFISTFPSGNELERNMKRKLNKIIKLLDEEGNAGIM